MRHVALIKIRGLELLDQSTVEGLIRTISQLIRLGLVCMVVIEPDKNSAPSDAEDYAIMLRSIALSQAARLITAMEKVKPLKARQLNDLLGFEPSSEETSATVQVRGEVEVQYPELLWRSLTRGAVPVITPLAFAEDTQRIVDIDANDAILAIVRELAGVRRPASVATDNEELSAIQAKANPDEALRYVLDRLILLDPTGSTPSMKRSDKTHVFLNLEQEYEETRQELLQLSRKMQQPLWQHHLRNLDLLWSTLTLLPPTSSALLTTPWQAATPSVQDSESDALGVQTRRPKNPLIFNLLTDKPLISSSLPAARMNKHQTAAVADDSQISSQATFAKRGMPVTIIPNPSQAPWEPPSPNSFHMSLEDAHVDFPRLLHLIEDSFNRPLDVSHYLERIRNKIAGVIVAGEYEGGAILTWELPPGVPDDGSESSRQRMVPYLDKFAVLKRSQGAGGVADIVFSAMVRTCFPNGLCWRSRRDNPVNKWYFERSVGTWKIKESNWTMFWTNVDLQQDSQRWQDYVSVCRTVMPSWADNKSQLD